MVIPAKAGIQPLSVTDWIPAFAGMTSEESANETSFVTIGVNRHDPKETHHGRRLPRC